MESKKWGAGAELWTGRKPPHPPYLTRVEKAILFCSTEGHDRHFTILSAKPAYPLANLFPIVDGRQRLLPVEKFDSDE